MSVVADPIHQTRQAAAGAAPRNWAKPVGELAPQTAKGETSIAPQNIEEITWSDVVDAVNPLHQLPVIGDVYRAITGEKISGMARVAGGFIFGGIAGGLVAALTAAYAEANDDQSPGEQLVSQLLGATPDTEEMAVAETEPSASQPEPQLARAGKADGDIPTVTITAEDSATAQNAASLASTAPTIAQAAPPPNFARTQSAASVAGATSPATSNAILPAVGNAAPLRERLNQKKQAPGFSDTPRPLSLSTFIDRLPANAATLSTQRAQNLELLQGVTGTHKSESLASAQKTSTVRERIIAEGPAIPPAAPQQQSNPLPADLVRDMMLQGLDKYANLPATHEAISSSE